MLERNNSFTRRSCSIKAEGATVPLSEGWVDICRKRERSAEKRVGGFGGMGMTFWAVNAPSFIVPDVDALRSGFRRTGTKGVGLETSGGGAFGSIGKSGDCNIRSLNGAQKYRAWMTELA